MKLFCKRFWFAAMTALGLICSESVGLGQSPRIVSITVSGGQVSLGCVFATGDSIELQASSSVTGAWSLMGSATGGTSPVTFVVPVTAAQRFFRIRDVTSGAYSVNTAGYINLNPGNSWSLIANQLLGVARLQDLFPVPPDGTTVYKVGAGGVDCSLYDELGADWFDCATFNPSAMTLRPGEGAFFSGSQGLTETLVGEVPEVGVKASQPGPVTPPVQATGAALVRLKLRLAGL